MELSGTLGSSMRRWSNVHINIKSTSVAWLMVLGMEGKRSGVLVPVWMETSGPPTGVAAGFSCPADPSTPAAGRGAGPSKSCGSSKRNCELCDDSTIETSAVLSVSATVVHCDRTVTCGRAVPCCRAVPCGWAIACSWAVPCFRAVACGRSQICGRVVACDRAVAHCWPVTRGRAAARCRPAPAEPFATGLAPAEPSATGAGTGTAGADSKWICRAGDATTVIVCFSGVLDFGGDSWNSRLTTNVQPVLSELSRRLSRWLGWDLRSGDDRDEDEDRDRRSPVEWC